jgi:hypothetical protein
MARPPAPPGPPPPHYRPPGTPRPAPAPLAPLRVEPPAPPSGIGPGAATAVAALMLLVGVVAGFFLGRAYDEADVAGSAPALTTPAPRSEPPTGDTVPQQPPTPPATDLPPAVLGTIDEPIPAGQAYVLGLYEIEVRAVDRDASAALRDHLPANPEPPADQVHVLVELGVRFTGTAGLGNPASIPFFLSDGDREWSAFEARCGMVPRPLTEAGLLGEGDDVVGNVCFTVPADVADSVALGTESFSGSLYFALP